MAAIPQAIHQNQKINLLEQIDRKKLFARINKIPKLQSSRIVFYDGNKLIELRPHPPMCMANKLTVVIKPKEKQEKIVGQNLEVNRQDNSSFYSELASTGLSCGAAVLSWIAVGGSSAAIPVSGGTSAAITILAWGAATASSAQCANSAYRLYNETDYGNSEMNAWLDSQAWYNSTTTVLDIVSVAGGVAAAGATVKMALNLSKSTGKSFKEVLKQLTRHERKRLTEELIRAQNPGISNKALKMFVNAGKYPKRYSNLEISSSVRLQLKDAMGAAFSFAGSASSGIIRSPNRIPEMGIAIIEEFETW
ncbi:MAG: hypothetical protein OQK98_10550 [Gammaproteobacteria bacterium]|nr:hypothetical protein [Gammaproteobacteria bacterium]